MYMDLSMKHESKENFILLAETQEAEFTECQEQALKSSRSTVAKLNPQDRRHRYTVLEEKKRCGNFHIKVLVEAHIYFL